jgi:hypothetical protein
VRSPGWYRRRERAYYLGPLFLIHGNSDGIGVARRSFEHHEILREAHVDQEFGGESG